MKFAKSSFTKGEEDRDSRKSKRKNQRTRRKWSANIPPKNVHAKFPIDGSHTITVDGFTMQGRRPYQEDRILVIPDLRSKASQISQVRDFETIFVGAGFSPPRRLALFAVVDGHAGFRAAEYVVGDVAEMFWKATEQATLNAELDHSTNAMPFDERVAEKRGRGAGDDNSKNSTSGNMGRDECLDRANTKKTLYPSDSNHHSNKADTEDAQEIVSRIVCKALKDTILALDQAWLERVRGARPKINDGACVLLCLMVDSKMHLAHVGDCRAILCSPSGKFGALTKDHKPGVSKKEDRRIQNAGGEVRRGQNGAEARVCAAGTRISITRAVGDANLKRGALPIISSEADTTTVDLAGKNGWWLVMASDGVWFRMGNATVSSFLRKSKHEANTGMASRKGMLKEKGSTTIAESLVRESYRRGSFDNISAVIISASESKP